jgi:hypothetical protein
MPPLPPGFMVFGVLVRYDASLLRMNPCLKNTRSPDRPRSLAPMK